MNFAGYHRMPKDWNSEACDSRHAQARSQNDAVYLVTKTVNVWGQIKIKQIIGLNTIINMFLVEYNNVYYTIIGNMFRPFRPSLGHRYVKFKKDWLHVVYVNFKYVWGSHEHQCQNLLITLSFVCDKLY